MDIKTVNVQDSLLKAIDIVVNDQIKNTKFTVSNIGQVKSVAGFDCVVELAGSEYNCILPEHLHDWIQEDDIVVVQDLYSDNIKKIVVGKIGTSRPTSFTIYDTDAHRSVSGVEQLHDTETGNPVNVILEVE